MLCEQPPRRFRPIPWNEGLFPSGGREWFELPTLWSLHEYCSASEEQHPGRKSEFVAYVHRKTGKYWRDTMMDELLSEAAVGKCGQLLWEAECGLWSPLPSSVERPEPNLQGLDDRYLVSLFRQLLVGSLR